MTGYTYKTYLFPFIAALFVCISCLTLFCVVPAEAQDDLEAREYQIKSSFLYRFIQFAQWSANPEAREVTLCVLGKSRYPIISRSLQGKKVRDKPIHVVQINGTDQVEKCQVLFISGSTTETGLLDLQLLSNKTILTVGETDNFTRHGGLIRFYKVKNKIRFEVNLSAAEKAGISFSSKLLKLAKLV